MTEQSGAFALINPNNTTTSLIVAEKFGKRHDDVLKRIYSLDAPLEINARNFAGVDPDEFVDLEDFLVKNFERKNYTDSKGEARPIFHITRDGFSLLVMGFTGKKALAWKIRFLQAFGAMEAALQTGGLQSQATPDELEARERRRLNRIVHWRGVMAEAQHQLDQLGAEAAALAPVALAAPSDVLTEKQANTLRRAITARVREECGAHADRQVFARAYRAVYHRFGVTKHYRLPQASFEEAIEFIGFSDALLAANLTPQLPPKVEA